jgi:hypothetical protein
VSADRDGGRVCIFCARAGSLTKEDAIPQWIIRRLNLDPSETWSADYETGGIFEERTHQYSSGSTLVTVRRVCTSCNSGWMSDLEGIAIPLVGPMLEGEAVSLTPAQQLDVATWAAKTFMVLEFHGVGSVVATADERALLMSRTRPPANVAIRIARRGWVSEDDVRVQFRNLLASDDRDEDAAPNLFSTTLVLGELIVQGWGGAAHPPHKMTEMGSVSVEAIVLWPPVPSTVRWPPAVAVTDFEVFCRAPFPGTPDGTVLADWRRRKGYSA